MPQALILISPPRLDHAASACHLAAIEICPTHNGMNVLGKPVHVLKCQYHEAIGCYPVHAKGVKCALRVPVESSHLIPKTLKRLRVAFARNNLGLTG